MARTPGPITPDKYTGQGLPAPGPYYAGIPGRPGLGEQQGYIYDPYHDRYIIDPKGANKYAIDSGLKEKPPIEPGFGNTLATVGGVALVGAGAHQLGTRLTQGSTPASPAATPAAPATSGGLLGSPSTGTPAPTPQEVPPTPTQAPAPTGTSNGMLGGATREARVISSQEPIPEGYKDVGDSSNGGKVVAPEEAISSDGTVNLGRIAQGAAGTFQLYQGYKLYKEGDKLGAGLNATAGSVNVAASLGSETAGNAAPYVNAALGAKDVYNILGNKDLSDKDKVDAINKRAMLGVGDFFSFGGASIADAILAKNAPGVSKGIDKILSLSAIPVIAKQFMSSKDKFQLVRDKVREGEVKQGALRQDEKGHQWGKLADGTEFDFSQDGKKYGKPQFNNPLYGEAASFGDVLASAQGLSGKAREAAATLYANASVSNAKDPAGVQANFQAFVQQRGLDQAKIQAQLDDLKAKKKIDDNQYAVWSANAQKITSAAPATAPAAPGAVTGTNGVAITTKPLISTLPSAPARSKTRSPGLDKNGNRIKY